MKREFGLACILLAATHSLWAQGDDPPARVGRLSYLTGTVSFQPAGTDDWTDAVLNYPVTTNDRLWADDQSRAEVHVGSAAIRLSARTAFSFLNLDDHIVQIRLSEGALDVTIRELPEDQSFEVDTPNAAIMLVRPGRYRINGDPESMRTFLTIRAGEAEVTAGGYTTPIRGQQAAQIIGDDTVSTNMVAPLPPDEFDRWADERNDRESRRPPPRYVSREMVGYEDLDSNGVWREEPGYGAVWAPRVAAGWAPYRDGRWAWVEPWGWTWIDDAPWGFAPFHYGRWANVRGSWVWAPGAVVARPVYAPALVAFVGGNSWSASLSLGGGGGVGWFPLGPREVYAPAYHVSPTYVTRINQTNVTNVTNINVTNVTYVNQRVPGAVTAVSRADFAGSRQVGRVAVAVPAAAVASAPVVSTAAPVAPRAAGILAGRAAGARPVARPPQAVLNRPVVVKTAPPPAAVPFAARQAALTANPGRPVAPAALSEIRRAQPVQAQPVRQATPAQRGGQPVQQQPAQAARPVAPTALPAQPAPASRIEQPQTRPAPRVEQPQARPVAPAQPTQVQPTPAPRVEQPRTRPAPAAQPTQVQPTPAPRVEQPRTRPAPAAQPTQVQPTPAPRVEQPRTRPAPAAQPTQVQPTPAPRVEQPQPRPATPAQPTPARPAPSPRVEQPPQSRTEQPRQRSAQPTPPAAHPAAPARTEPQRQEPPHQRAQPAEQTQQHPQGRPATTPEQKQKRTKAEEEKK